MQQKDSIENLIKDIEQLGPDVCFSNAALLARLKAIAEEDAAARWGRSESLNSWRRVERFSAMYRREAGQEGKGFSVWIDEGVKATLEKLKPALDGMPVRHIVSAIVRTWFEENRIVIESQIEQNDNSLISR